MSGVRAAASLALDHEASTEDLDAMQDVLYDILATGMDPEQVDVPAGEIEGFLFEHARAPKSLAEFRAFFAQHGLTVRRIAAPAPDASFALPPLDSPPHSGAALLDFPLDGDEELTGQHSLHGHAGVSAARRPSLASVAWVGLAVLCLGFVGVAWVGYGVVQELRSDLDRAEQRGDAQDRVIDGLEGRAVGIQSSIEANGQLINRMEQKSDLLIDSLIAKPEPPTKKRWKPRGQ